MDHVEPFNCLLANFGTLKRRFTGVNVLPWKVLRDTHTILLIQKLEKSLKI